MKEIENILTPKQGQSINIFLDTTVIFDPSNRATTSRFIGNEPAEDGEECLLSLETVREKLGTNIIFLSMLL